MQPASEHHIPDGLLASITLLSEKPRHGATSRKSAPQSGIHEANSTAAIGLQFRCWEIASGTVDAPSKLTSLLRKIGNYIPVPCGGGAFAYGGLNVGAVFNVQVAKWFQYDTREGGSKGTFAEGSAGEVIVGGVGQQFTPGQPVETYGFLGVGGSAGVASGNVSVFASNSGSIGYAAEGGVGGLGGGVGIYQNWDTATSCFDHRGR